MEQLSTDDLRRRQPAALRRVIAGESLDLTTYGASIGVCVVPASEMERLALLDAKRLAQLSIAEASE